MPVIQSQTDVWTYGEMVAYVLDAHALGRESLNVRHARDAVRRAYRDLPIRHTWNYYYRQMVLQTVADYATGTVAFDYTGGANERQLTLTTGTWPSWAAFGRVIIDDVHYEVENRVSDSIITLAENSNPGADVTAGETYTIYRNSYPLPVNFRCLNSLWIVDNNYELSYVDERRQHSAMQYFYSTPGTPLHYTIRATGKYLGSQELVFGPPPDSLSSYDMLYEISPRPLMIDEYSNGTVAITTNSATVTRASTTFPTNCAGAIIRFSTGPVKPSGFQGSIDGADNPYIYQGVIKSRDSATQLTLTEVMPATVASLSAVGYTISDPLDIDVTRMLSALQMAAEAEFSRLAMRADASERAGMARRALLEAMEADAVQSNVSGSAISPSIRRATVTNDT